MKIYFAATAPGNENENNCVGNIPIKKRLLSYYLIIYKKFDCNKVFQYIKKNEIILGRNRSFE